MPGADVSTPGQRYKVRTVYVNMQTGVAYDEQDPVDKSRMEIQTTLTVFHLNNRQKDYGAVLFPSTDHVLRWAKRIANQRRTNYRQ